MVVVGLWLTWSTAFIAIKIGLTLASPVVFALLRVLAAIAAMGAVLLVLRLVHGRAESGSGLHRYAAVLGATNVTGFLVFQNLGMVDLQVGLSAVLIYTQPLLVAIGAQLFLRQRLTIRRVVGLLCGWFGVLVVVSAEAGTGAAPLPAVLLLLAAALSWTVGTLVFSSVSADIDLWPLLFWQNVYGVLPIAVLTLLRSGTVEWGGPLLASAAWAGIGASVGGFGLQFVLLRRGEASVVSSWIFAVPILAGGLGVLVLGDVLRPGLAVGAVLAAAGIYLVNTTARRKTVPV